ncbi:paraquat-inducible protein A [Candidatus Methylocalor cossyra]|uniref:Paraquat-inducible protein A n=1 Tax=Candidatus Methylocalor cossyra TaxID=3108543 RepID=A0ABM9NK96_9GAMM
MGDRMPPGRGPAPLIVCHQCDLVQREIPLTPGAAALCRRCGALLYRSPPGGLDRPLALLAAAAILFLLANAFPIVAIESQGTSTATTLLGAVATLWAEGMPLIAGLVLFTTFLAPAFEIFSLFALLLAFRRGRPGARLAVALRWVLATRPWSMTEVFLLGVLVSVVKLSHLAHVVPGVALWSWGLLIGLFTAALATFDPHGLWARLPLRQ